VGLHPALELSEEEKKEGPGALYSSRGSGFIATTSNCWLLASCWLL
jgi:hypothetical protein